jgi:hypothetical protein
MSGLLTELLNARRLCACIELSPEASRQDPFAVVGQIAFRIIASLSWLCSSDISRIDRHFQKRDGLFRDMRVAGCLRRSIAAWTGSIEPGLSRDIHFRIVLLDRISALGRGAAVNMPVRA